MRPRLTEVSRGRGDDSVNQATDDVLEANSRSEELAEFMRGASELRIDLDRSGCFAEFAERDAVDAALVRATAPSGTLREIERTRGEALSRMLTAPSIGDAHSPEPKCKGPACWSFTRR